MNRVAEVTQRHEGPSPKSLDSDENLRPNLRHFVAILRFVVIFAFFFEDFGHESAFWVKYSVFLGKRCTITWYICIL